MCFLHIIFITSICSTIENKKYDKKNMHILYNTVVCSRPREFLPGQRREFEERWLLVPTFVNIYFGCGRKWTKFYQSLPFIDFEFISCGLAVVSVLFLTSEVLFVNIFDRSFEFLLKKNPRNSTADILMNSVFQTKSVTGPWSKRWVSGSKMAGRWKKTYKIHIIWAYYIYYIYYMYWLQKIW